MFVQIARNLVARKPVGAVIAHARENEGARREGAPVRPTVLAVGAMTGAGLFLVAGHVAAQQAGPAVALSILIAGLVCLLVALCCAELASAVPVSGFLYTHAYAALGELPAWICAWLGAFALILGTAVAAVAWSGAFQDLLAGLGLGTPGIWSAAPFASDGVELDATGAAMNMPAVFITGAAALLLVSGASQGGLVHTGVVALTVLVPLVLVTSGVSFVEPDFWRPLVAEGPVVPQGQPGRFGWAGVTTGAALMVFAFLGFDRVWTAPRTPGSSDRARVAAVLAALAACTLLFAAAALVLTGLAGSESLDDPAPFALAVQARDALRWLGLPFDVVLVVGLGSAVLGLLHANARLLQSVSRDRLLPDAFDRVHPHTSALTVGVAAPAWAAGAAAALLPSWTLVALASGAALLAFAVACGGVVWLRLARRPLRGAFRAPVWWLTAPLGLVACLYLVWSLGRSTMAWLGVWLLLGLLFYVLYGFPRSPHHVAPPDPEDEPE